MPLYRLNPGTGGTGSIQGHVATAPPAGKHPVTNLYWNPIESKLVGDYDTTGVGTGTIQSAPPVGSYAVTNVYYDPATDKLVGEYDDGA